MITVISLKVARSGKVYAQWLRPSPPTNIRAEGESIPDALRQMANLIEVHEARLAGMPSAEEVKITFTTKPLTES